MLRVEVLAPHELALLLRGLGGQRVRERAGLVELERDEGQLFFGDLDLEAERLRLRLRVGLLFGEVGDARVGRVDGGLKLICRLLVAFGVLPRHGDGALELFLAPEGILERIVGRGGHLLADEEGEGSQRDDGRAQPALPPRTSPDVPGSSHRRRMFPLRAATGQGATECHFARWARTDSVAPPAPTSSATPRTLPASWNANSGPSEIGSVTRKSSIAPVTGPEAAKTTESATTAPSAPTSMPSRMNGQRTNASDAPTSCMISISSRRACTAMRMVFTITNSATNSIIARIARPPTDSTRVMVSSWSTISCSRASACSLVT